MTPTKAILKKQKMASTPTRAGEDEAKMSLGEDNDPNPNENVPSAVDDNGLDPRCKNKTREEGVKTNLGQKFESMMGDDSSEAVPSSENPEEEVLVVNAKQGKTKSKRMEDEALIDPAVLDMLELSDDGEHVHHVWEHPARAQMDRFQSIAVMVGSHTHSSSSLHIAHSISQAACAD